MKYNKNRTQGINTFETPSTSLLQQTHPSIPFDTKLNLHDSHIAKHLHGQVIISLVLTWQITQSNLEDDNE